MLQHSTSPCEPVRSCGTTDPPAWLAVQVRAGRELYSAQHLRQRGCEVFLPCYQERRQWSDRVKTIERALFEGYLFCHTPLAACGTIVTAPGIIRVVGVRHEPQPIAPEEIEALQRIDAAQLRHEPWPFLHEGQRVRLALGPLRGTEGVILSIKNQHRLVVAVTLLQRSVAVELDPSWITTSGPSIPRQMEAGR